jgi:hypothetical protein
MDYGGIFAGGKSRIPHYRRRQGGKGFDESSHLAATRLIAANRFAWLHIVRYTSTI